MIEGKHGAVIGQKCIHQPGIIDWAHAKKKKLRPITAPYFPLIIKPRNFAKRQCKLQCLIPPTTHTQMSTALPSRDSSRILVVRRALSLKKAALQARGKTRIQPCKLQVSPSAMIITIHKSQTRHPEPDILVVNDLP